MMLVFELRAKLTALYQKYAFWINLAARFLLCYLAFKRIHSVLDYNPTLGKNAVLLALSGICAVLPSTLMVIIAAVYVSMQIYASSEGSLILTIIVFALFLVFYCFFIRFTPKYGAVVLAIPVLQTYGFPYIVPILLGLFGSPVSIVSVCCGVFAYHTLFYAKENIPLDIPKEDVDVDMQAIYMNVVKQLIANPAMYVTMLILAVVITVVYFIRRIRMDFAFEISIAVGTGVMILGYIIGDLRYDLGIKIAGMVIACLICAGVSLVILFFCRTLQYSAAEHVEFEDDDYYYYVKAVPKIKAGAPKRKEKKVIRRRRRTDDDDEDEYEDAALGLIEYGDNEAGSPTLRKKKAEAEREREEEEEADEFGDDLSIDDLKPPTRYGTRVGERPGRKAGRRRSDDPDRAGRNSRRKVAESNLTEDDPDDDVIAADPAEGWSRVSKGSNAGSVGASQAGSAPADSDFEDDEDEEEVIRGYYPGSEGRSDMAGSDEPVDDDDEEEVIRGYYPDHRKPSAGAAAAGSDEDDDYL